MTSIPIHGALNVAYCQVLELATYGSAPTFQPKDESALQEMQFLPTGPYNLITPGIHGAQGFRRPQHRAERACR